MATMDDIARHLGVTRGTVSKALSGAADVSGTMRKSVLEAAVELGYSRIPRTGASRRVCIFIQNMDWEKPEDFGWEIVTGFRKLAEPAGYQVDIVPLTEPLQKASPYDEYMLLHGYQGALFLGLTLLDPWMKDFQTCSTPAVLYDSCVKPNPAVTQVGIDNDEGMDMAVTRLLDRGCTAIICSHDLLAHMVLIHCLELGIAVPRQLSVIGFDDLPLCQYTIPPLSTIRQNRTELGKSAFYALSCQIEGTPISTLLLHAELIERRSAGQAPDAAAT